MLSFEDLNEHSFSKKINGYNTTEVNDYIQYILDKYKEIFEQNESYERKLAIANEKLEKIYNAGESAEKIIENAKSKAEEIIKEADLKARSLSDAVNESCESAIKEYRKKVVVQTEVLCELSLQCNEFRNKILRGYRSQIDFLQNTDFVDNAQKSEEELINEVLISAKERIYEKKEQKQKENLEAQKSVNDFSPITVSEERTFYDYSTSESVSSEI